MSKGNGHGGKRNGAGRKKGSATEKTREIANQAAAEGITPLQVMMEAMIEHRTAGRLDKAAAIAKDAAPYMHPRLSYVKSDVTLSDADADEALETELEGLLRCRQAASPDPPETPGRSDNGHAGSTNGAGPVADGSSPLF